MNIETAIDVFEEEIPVTHLGKKTYDLYVEAIAAVKRQSDLLDETTKLLELINDPQIELHLHYEEIERLLKKLNAEQVVKCEQD